MNSYSLICSTNSKEEKKRNKEKRKFEEVKNKVIKQIHRDLIQNGVRNLHIQL